MSGIEDREMPRLTRRAALAQGSRQPRRGQLAPGSARGLRKLELVLIVGVIVVVRVVLKRGRCGKHDRDAHHPHVP